MKIALLPDRGVLRVSGADAAKLLSGVITNDMARLDGAPALHTGLLSPQGKILFDFFVVKTAEGFLIETARAAIAGLKQRLEMYRLRAAAEIADVSADHSVSAAWDIGAEEASHSRHTIVFADPRHPALGMRYLASLASNWRRDLAGAEVATRSDSDAHRIALGVPEAGRDFAIGDTFPHEALYDLTQSVSFRKGCYVGQEVVSRMQHKSVVRKRVTRVSGAALAAGGDVKLGEVAIGTIGTVVNGQGLALVRLDRVVEAIDKGVPLTAGGAPVEIDADMIARFRASLAERPQGL
jgi:folate-binding protein YgfZ